MRSFLNILVEAAETSNRLDFLRKKYTPLFANKIGGIPQDKAAKLVDNIIEFDPNPQHKNSEWLLSRALNNRIKLSTETRKLKYTLSLFDKLKHRLPAAMRDLNRYRDIQEVYNTVQPFETELLQKEHEGEKQNAKILYDGNDYKIVIPLSNAASCYYAKGAQWCTAHPDDERSMFKRETKFAPIIIIIEKNTNNKWQLWNPPKWISKGYFIDPKHNYVDIHRFLEDRPQLVDALKPYIQEYRD